MSEILKIKEKYAKEEKELHEKEIISASIWVYRE